MDKRRAIKWRSGIPAAVLCAGAAALVLVPSAGFALGAIESSGIDSGMAFTPASIGSRLAGMVGENTGGDLMRFTPAGATVRTGRSMTVAVRVDDDVAQALSVRSAITGVNDQALDSPVARVAPTRFNLGLARGYQSFANTPELARDLSDAAMPDLAAFKPSAGVKDKPSRFAARIALEEEQTAGRSPRTAESISDQSVDVGGSYRVTRNLDVTAGVRYSQDRDRLAPITNGKQDSQAVYVGTQFRF